jgi:hypothetical protein
LSNNPNYSGKCSTHLKVRFKDAPRGQYTTRALAEPGHLIPCNVEILGWSCFSSCKSLTSISFELNSRLTRIESDAFSDSSLQSIVIPSNVCFINASAFVGVNLSNCLIESGNQKFVCENAFLINVVDHKLIRSFSTSSHLEILTILKFLGHHVFQCVNHSHQSYLNQVHD